MKSKYRANDEKIALCNFYYRFIDDNIPHKSTVAATFARIPSSLAVFIALILLYAYLKSFYSLLFFYEITVFYVYIFILLYVLDFFNSFKIWGYS